MKKLVTLVLIGYGVVAHANPIADAAKLVCNTKECLQIAVQMQKAEMVEMDHRHNVAACGATATELRQKLELDAIKDRKLARMLDANLDAVMDDEVKCIQGANAAYETAKAAL